MIYIGIECLQKLQEFEIRGRFSFKFWKLFLLDLVYVVPSILDCKTQVSPGRSVSSNQSKKYYSAISVFLSISVGLMRFGDWRVALAFKKNLVQTPSKLIWDWIDLNVAKMCMKYFKDYRIILINTFVIVRIFIMLITSN